MNATSQPLLNKTALITGASQRLGAASAKRLHDAGANIIIHYNHSSDKAQALVDILNNARSNSAHCLQADLNDQQAIADLAKKSVAIYQRLDILINNASAFYPTPFGEGSLADWDALFNSNAKAPFFLSQHLKNALHANKGCIINMIDIHAERPLKDHSIYCMAKSSLATLTLSLAKELAPNIRVNGVAPGAILWPENASDETKKSILKEIPLERIGRAEDIANTVLFLISADYITGQIIAVDGGRSL